MENAARLGIPVLADRCHQATGPSTRWNPSGRPGSSPSSYGFRPGRGCADAIAALFTTLKGKSKRVWIVDADLSAAFDRIDHSRLLAALGSFPARGMIAGWLKAGVIEDGAFTPTEEGTPQGGVISPLMMNVALHGLEEAAGVRYQASGRHAGDTVPGCPVVVRYADDLVACCSLQAAGRAGQGPARRVAGAPGTCLQRGQDQDRAPHRGVRFPRGSTSAATETASC